MGFLGGDYTIIFSTHSFLSAAFTKHSATKPVGCVDKTYWLYMISLTAPPIVARASLFIPPFFDGLDVFSLLLFRVSAYLLEVSFMHILSNFDYFVKFT